LHCIIFLLRPPKKSFRLALFFVQLGIIFLALHVRVNANWQLVSICLAGLIGLRNSWRSDHGDDERPGRMSRVRRVLPSAALLILIVLGRISLASYENAQYSSSQQDGTKRAGHMFWHSIFQGLAQNPRLAQKYRLRIDDFTAFRATGEFLEESGRSAEWRRIGGTSAGYRDLQKAEYDNYVGQLLWKVASEHPREVAAAIGCYKPAALASNLLWLMGLRLEPANLQLFVSPETCGDVVLEQMSSCKEKLTENGQWATPWNTVALCILVPFLALHRQLFGSQARTAFTAAMLLTLGSIIPALAGYSAPWYVSEPFLAIFVSIYLLMGWMILRVLALGG
jgi:hypothetical protein